MNRNLSNLAPSLFLALVILIATALTVAAPHESWTAAAGPLFLALALIGFDVVQRRRSGGHRSPVSVTVLVLAASILVSCGIVAYYNFGQLALMIPILGSSIVTPLLLQKDAPASCRRA